MDSAPDFEISVENKNIHVKGQDVFTNCMVKLNSGEVSEALSQRLVKLHCMKSMFTKTHVTIDRGLGVILKARLGL